MKAYPMLSTSAATDSAWLAAADIAGIASDLGVKYRLIGGIAVTLLTHHYGVDDQVIARETADADMGVPREVCADERLPAALLNLGYEREGGNRFTRKQPGDKILTIDVLAPSLTGRLEPNHDAGDLTVDLVPGLTTALRLEAVHVTIAANLASGGTITTTLDLPSLIGALTLKAYAYTGRVDPNDAVDIYRLLVAADAAGLTASDWPTQGGAREAGALLHRHFEKTNSPILRRALPRSRDRADLRLLVRKIVLDPHT